MQDHEISKIFIVILLVAIYFFIIREPKNKPQINLKSALKKQEISLTAEQIEKINSIISKRNGLINAPATGKIQKNLQKFEQKYRSGVVDFSTMNDLSPLSCYGYRVGRTSDLTAIQRKDVILHTWYATLPSFLPDDYRDSWGEPGTYERYLKIVKHLDMLIGTRGGRTQMHYAISDWSEDKNWFINEHRQTALIYRDYANGNPPRN